MKIYIGADHNGFQDKATLIDYLRNLGHEVVDDGDRELDPDDDFPIFASNVARSVLDEHSPDCKGILLCGSGQGVCMAANRFKGIRATLCWDEDEAASSRADDDANILCLSSRKFDIESMKHLIDVWLDTPFAAEPRFIRRIEELDKLG